MEIRRPVRVFHDEPARRNDREIDDRMAGFTMRGSGQNSEDARVGVVIEDAADETKPREVVFVRVIGPMPGCDVEWGVLLLAGV